MQSTSFVNLLEVDNIVFCARQDPRNDLEITVRGGRREGEVGGDGLLTVV